MDWHNYGCDIWNIFSEINHTMKTEMNEGDCLEIIESMPDNSVDAVVTDPPWNVSGIVKLWKNVMRVLKPRGRWNAFNPSDKHTKN